jgi:hypothetical protein
MKKTKLQVIAADHDLDETVYVRLTEDPFDSSMWQFDAANEPNKEQLLFDDESMVVGVYKLVSVERVSRKQELFTEVLA